MSSSPGTPVSSTVSTIAAAIANAEGYNTPGSIPAQANNPGDLELGDIGYGTMTTSDGGQVTIFPTPEAGQAALNNQVSAMLDGTSADYNPDMTLAEIGQIYAGGSAWADNMASYLHVTPDTTLANAAAGVSASGAGGGDGGTGNPTQDEPPLGNDPPYAVPIQGQTLSASTVAALQSAANPSLVIMDGLANTPWFQDTSILKVNSNTTAVGSPVTFKIYFDPDNNFGTNGAPLSTQGFAGTPIVVKLNASLQSFEREMKHVSNRTTTRTGMLITLWGMAPDMIVGSGSTGLFMNQLGVTDFLSLSTLTDEAKQIIQRGLAHRNVGSTLMTLAANGQSLPSRLTADGAFRIAAKDAFVELLSVFKNNAIVWYRAAQEQVDGIPKTQQTLAPMTWSSQAGASTYQMGHRNNDVLTRGKVAMSFRNAVYYGYFKSFSWTMDAASPFRWVFNFAFQVERTVIQAQVPPDQVST